MSEFVASNPFAALIHPTGVLEACAKSPQLKAMAGQVFRPLDKPRTVACPEQAAFDAEVDAGTAPIGKRTPAETPVHRQSPIVAGNWAAAA